MASPQLLRDERRDALREALLQLRRGIRSSEGVLPALEKFIGLPGIDAMERRLAQLRAHSAEQVELADPTLRPYRPIVRKDGSFGKFYIDLSSDSGVELRRLQPGETVMLTRARGRSLVNVLEEVPAEEVSAEAEAAAV